MAERYTRTSQLAALRHILRGYRALGMLGGRLQTLDTFAAALNQAPGVRVTKQAVNYWELGKYLPRLKLCLQLSRAQGEDVAPWVAALGMDLLAIHNAAPLGQLSEVGREAYLMLEVERPLHQAGRLAGQGARSVRAG